MYKQLVLNLFHSKWIWYIGIATIIINFITATLPSDIQSIILPYSSWANVFSIVFTTASYLFIHEEMKKNNNHHFFFTLPNTKRIMFQGDYLYYAIMILFTSLIIASYLATDKEMYYIYGFMMLIGVSLIVMSVYYLGFSKHWMRYVFNGYILYSVPMILTYIFHFLLVRNINEMNLNLPNYETFLYQISYYTLAIGIIVFIATYFINRRNVTKYDMI